MGSAVNETADRLGITCVCDAQVVLSITEENSSAPAWAVAFCSAKQGGIYVTTGSGTEKQ